MGIPFCEADSEQLTLESPSEFKCSKTNIQSCINSVSHIQRDSNPNHLLDDNEIEIMSYDSHISKEFDNSQLLLLPSNSSTSLPFCVKNSTPSKYTSFDSLSIQKNHSGNGLSNAHLTNSSYPLLTSLPPYDNKQRCDLSLHMDTDLMPIKSMSIYQAKDCVAEALSETQIFSSTEPHSTYESKKSMYENYPSHQAKIWPSDHTKGLSNIQQTIENNSEDSKVVYSLTSLFLRKAKRENTSKVDNKHDKRVIVGSTAIGREKETGCAIRTDTDSIKEITFESHGVNMESILFMNSKSAIFTQNFDSYLSCEFIPNQNHFIEDHWLNHEFYRLLKNLHDKEFNRTLLKKAHLSLKEQCEKNTDLWTEKKVTCLIPENTLKCVDHRQLSELPSSIDSFDFNQEKYRSLALKIKHSYALKYKNLAKNHYELVMTMLRIRYYCYDLICKSGILNLITQLSSDFYSDSKYSNSMTKNINGNHIECLKELCNILFYFERTSESDLLLIEDESDTSRLDTFHDFVSDLLRDLFLILSLATTNDLIWIVEHLVHCPSIKFQLPNYHLLPRFPDLSIWKMESYMQNYIKSLKILLSPILKYQHCVYNGQMLSSSELFDKVKSAQDNNDDNSPSCSSFFLLSEERFMDLWIQFNFSYFIENFMSYTFNQNAKDIEELKSSSASCFSMLEDVITIIASSIWFFIPFKKFTNQLVLAMFRIASDAMSCAKSITDQYLSNFRDTTSDFITMIKSQAEHLLFLTFSRIYFDPELWNFLVLLNLDSLSYDTTIAILSTTFFENPRRLNPNFTFASWKLMMKDQSDRSLFLYKLIQFSKAEFLLHLLVKLFNSHLSNYNLSYTILWELFNLAYILATGVLRNSIQKMVSFIYNNHPDFIGFLIDMIDNNIEILEHKKLLVSPLEGIRLNLFTPTMKNIFVIEKWLTANTKARRHLAKYIITELNFGYVKIPKFNLILSPAMHRQIFISTIKAYVLCLDRNKSSHGGDLTFWRKYISKKKYHRWNWHLKILLNIQHINRLTFKPYIPLLQDGDLLLKKMMAYNNNFADIDPFLAVSICMLSHFAGIPAENGYEDFTSCWKRFSTFGLPILKALASKKHYPLVLKLLLDLTSTFITIYKNQEVKELGVNDLVQDIILPLIQHNATLDQCISEYLEFSQTSKNIDCYKSNLISGIQYQIHSASKVDINHFPSASIFVSFWACVITSYPGWYKNHMLNCIFNSLARAAHAYDCDYIILEFLEKSESKLSSGIIETISTPPGSIDGSNVTKMRPFLIILTELSKSLQTEESSKWFLLNFFGLPHKYLVSEIRLDVLNYSWMLLYVLIVSINQSQTLIHVTRDLDCNASKMTYITNPIYDELPPNIKPLLNSLKFIYHIILSVIMIFDVTNMPALLIYCQLLFYIHLLTFNHEGSQYFVGYAFATIGSEILNRNRNAYNMETISNRFLYFEEQIKVIKSIEEDKLQHPLLVQQASLYHSMSKWFRLDFHALEFTKDNLFTFNIPNQSLFKKLMAPFNLRSLWFELISKVQVTQFQNEEISPYFKANERIHSYSNSFKYDHGNSSFSNTEKSLNMKFVPFDQLKSTESTKKSTIDLCLSQQSQIENSITSFQNRNIYLLAIKPWRESEFSEILPYQLIDNAYLVQQVLSDMEWLSNKANEVYKVMITHLKLDTQIYQLYSKLYKPCTVKIKQVLRCNLGEDCTGPVNFESKITIYQFSQMNQKLIYQKILQRSLLDSVEEHNLTPEYLEIVRRCFKLINTCHAIINCFEKDQNIIDNIVVMNIFVSLLGKHSISTINWPPTKLVFNYLEKMLLEKVLNHVIQDQVEDILDLLLLSSYELTVQHLARHWHPSPTPDLFEKMIFKILYKDSSHHVSQLPDSNIQAALLKQFDLRSWVGLVSKEKIRTMFHIIVQKMVDIGSPLAKSTDMTLFKHDCVPFKTVNSTEKDQFFKQLLDMINVLVTSDIESNINLLIEFLFEPVKIAKMQLSFWELTENLDFSLLSVSKAKEIFHLILQCLDSYPQYYELSSLMSIWKPHLNSFIAFIKNILHDLSFPVQIKTLQHEKESYKTLTKALINLFDFWLFRPKSSALVHDGYAGLIPEQLEILEAVCNAMVECLSIMQEKAILDQNILFEWMIRALTPTLNLPELWQHHALFLSSSPLQRLLHFSFPDSNLHLIEFLNLIDQLVETKSTKFTNLNVAVQTLSNIIQNINWNISPTTISPLFLPALATTISSIILAEPFHYQCLSYKLLFAAKLIPWSYFQCKIPINSLLTKVENISKDETILDMSHGIKEIAFNLEIINLSLYENCPNGAKFHLLLVFLRIILGSFGLSNSPTILNGKMRMISTKIKNDKVIILEDEKKKLDSCEMITESSSSNLSTLFQYPATFSTIYLNNVIYYLSIQERVLLKYIDPSLYPLFIYEIYHFLILLYDYFITTCLSKMRKSESDMQLDHDQKPLKEIIHYTNIQINSYACAQKELLTSSCLAYQNEEKIRRVIECLCTHITQCHPSQSLNIIQLYVGLCSQKQYSQLAHQFFHSVLNMVEPSMIQVQLLEKCIEFEIQFQNQTVSMGKEGVQLKHLTEIMTPSNSDYISYCNRNWSHLLQLVHHHNAMTCRDLNAASLTIGYAFPTNSYLTLSLLIMSTMVYNPNIDTINWIIDKLHVQHLKLNGKQLHNLATPPPFMTSQPSWSKSIPSLSNLFHTSVKYLNKFAKTIATRMVYCSPSPAESGNCIHYYSFKLANYLIRITELYIWKLSYFQLSNNEEQRDTSILVQGLDAQHETLGQLRTYLLKECEREYFFDYASLSSSSPHFNNTIYDLMNLFSQFRLPLLTGKSSFNPTLINNHSHLVDLPELRLFIHLVSLFMTCRLHLAVSPLGDEQKYLTLAQTNQPQINASDHTRRSWSNFIKARLPPSALNTFTDSETRKMTGRIMEYARYCNEKSCHSCGCYNKDFSYDMSQLKHVISFIQDPEIKITQLNQLLFKTSKISSLIDLGCLFLRPQELKLPEFEL